MVGLIELASIDAHELYRFYHIGDDETAALRGVSLSVFPGEIVAVTGPSGSGKSTLMHCLAGLDEPDAGWVTIAGARLTRRSEADRARLRAEGIGILLQSGNLLDQLTVTENLMLSSAIGGSPRRQFDDLLDSVGIGHLAHALPSRLSGGELARAGLALALVNDPAILLADEPTGEVDAASEQHLLDLFAKRSLEGGSTLIVTHSMAVAAAADRTIHLVDGRISHDQP